MSDREILTTISADWLESMGACKDQVAQVRATWPEGTPRTLESLRQAARAGLDLDWLACALPLSAAARERYETEIAAARERYETEIAPARERFVAETAAAWGRYRTERAVAWERYRTEVAQALWRAIQMTVEE